MAAGANDCLEQCSKVKFVTYRSWYIFVFVCVAVRVIRKISTKHYVFCVTSVVDELFVLLKREENQDQVAVYSINSYMLLRHFNLSV